MIEKVGIACCGCTACVNKCPKKCIEMKKNEEGFLYPMVRDDTCIHCGLCQEVCPILNMMHFDKGNLQEAWGVISKDIDVLLSSSSGGLFTALAEAVLAEKGCIYGAAFAEEFQTIQHIIVEKKEELSRLRGSKYIQSDMRNCFSSVKEQIQAGREVLFSGTPCQVAGLKKFLGKDSESVVFVDVICHGVPSVALWQRYLKHIKKRMQWNVTNVNFRHKEHRASHSEIKKTQNNHIIYYRTMREDPFMYMFLKDYCLRESCYRCNIKEVGSVSDITIGDFWGVDQVAPEIDNSLGVSLALIHTVKGEKLFERVKQSLDVKKVDYNAAIAMNSSYDHSANRPTERDCFYYDLSMLKWEQLKRKYVQGILRNVMKRKLSNSILGKIRRGIIRTSGREYKLSFRYGMMVTMEKSRKNHS